MALLLLVTALGLGWVGVRAALAYQHLSSIQRSASGAGSEVLSDPTKAGALVARLSVEATSARELTSDLPWRVFESAPWIGPQLSAFSDVAAATDEMLTNALLPLVAATQQTPLESLKPVDGRIDVNAITPLQAPADAAATRARAAAQSVSSIDRGPLVGVLSNGVDQIDKVFSSTAAQIDALSRTTKLLPGLLGGDSPKQYLVLVQNNAEWRSLGGIAGTLVLLRADQGKISLASTNPGTALSRQLDQPVTSLSPELTALYGDKPARYFQNLTQIPDFTIDGPLARDMYQKVTGTVVDGVLAIDPVVLSYLLNATGPVTLPDKSKLSADNAVPLFLNDVYKKYPQPSDQDAFFGGSTGVVFEAFLSGAASTPKLLAALSRATDEQRVRLWIADPSLQAVLAGSTLAGSLPVTTENTAAFGVYLNESGGSKMSYYVRPNVSLSWGQCAAHNTPGLRELTLTVALSSDAPADAQTSLPPYMTANGRYGVAPGNAATVGNIFLPPGWDVMRAETSDGAGFTTYQYQGRDVLSFESNLAPQTSSTATIVLRSLFPASQATAFVTPTAQPSISPVVTSTCEDSPVATLR